MATPNQLQRAYDAGRAGYWAQLPNPYRITDPCYVAWMRGFTDAASAGWQGRKPEVSA